MKTLSVNTISRKYEELYKKFEQVSTRDESFFAINNAIIFAYFSLLVGVHYDGKNFKNCCSAIEETYGTSLFFYNVKKTENYKNNLKEAIEVFQNLFENYGEGTKLIEQLLGNVLEKHINQKDTGSYYTPSETTRYISWNTIIIALVNRCDDNIRKKILATLDIDKSTSILNLHYEDENLVKSMISNLSEQQKKEVVQLVYKLKIIDPTCGSGAFILMVFECMEKLIKYIGVEKVNYNKILDCIYGVDISKEAIQLTKLRLIMRIANEDCDIEDFNVMFGKNFITTDTLKGNDGVIKDEIGFDWTNFPKFDCVIGNPPYVEMKEYVSEKFKTRKCGNLYAYTIERACNITANGGVVSFIVPLPFVSTPRMSIAKDYLEKKSSNVYYSTFADRPGCIFTGVHQRLTIFFAEINEDSSLNKYSSSYKYWYNEERENLYKNIFYYENTIEGILPKIGNQIELQIYNKFVSGPNKLFDILCDNSQYPIYLSTRIGFWTKAFLNNVFSSKEYKIYYANSEEDLYLVTSILNSSSFYFFWVISSDCWHITNKNLDNITFDLSKLTRETTIRLKDICIRLMADLEENKKHIGSKQTEFEYKHKYSKKIIDELDDALADLFGINVEELAYVKTFTEKYRLNTVEA